MKQHHDSMPEENITEIGTKGFHYGWMIAAISFLVVFVSLGLCNSPHGLYQIPVTTDTSLSRTQFSGIATFRFTATALFNLLFGFLYKKLGLRRIGTMGLLFSAAALLLFSLGSEPAMFYLGGIFLGAGSAFATTTFASTLISNWFNKNKGLVLGVVLCSSGIGGTIFSQLVSRWIETVGWRQSYRISAGIVALVAALAALVICGRPAEKGLCPIGGENARAGKAKNAETGMTLREACRTPQLYCVLLIALLVGFLNNPVYVAVPAQMADKGFSADQSALVMSIIFTSIAVAKIALGAIHDRIGLAATVSVCFLSNMTGLVLLLTAKTVWNYLFFAVIFGLSVPLENLVMSLIMGTLYGKRDYAGFVGVGVALSALGIGVGNLLMGYCFDTFGGYSQAIVACLVMSATAYTALMFIIRQRKNVSES